MENAPSALTGRHAMRGVFWGTVERIASQAISGIAVLVFARLLGPSDYGLVTLAATIALFGQMLLGESFSQALVQQKTVTPANLSSVFWALAGAGVVAAVVQIAAADAAAGYFKEPGLAGALRALSPLPLLAALQAVPAGLFRRELNFRALALSSSSAAAAAGVLGVGLACGGWGIWSLIASLLAQNVISLVTLWRRSPFRPQLAFSAAHFREFWAYARFNLLLRVSAFAGNQGPRIMIGALFGTAALGAFSLGLRIIEMLYQALSMPSVNVTVSVVARLRDDRAALESAILSAMQFSAMVSVPLFIGLAVVSPVLLPLLFGAKWSQSIVVVQWLCLFGAAGSCQLIWNAIVAGLGRPDVTLATSTVAAAVNLGVLLLAAPFGITAAAAAFVVRGYATLPLMPLLISRLTNIPVLTFARVYSPILAATGAMAAAAWLCVQSLSASVPASAVVACAIAVASFVYICVLWLLARPALALGWSHLMRLRPATA